MITTKLQKIYFTCQKWRKLEQLILKATRGNKFVMMRKTYNIVSEIRLKLHYLIMESYYFVIWTYVFYNNN